MIESENYVQGQYVDRVHMSRKDKAVDVLIVAHVHYVWVLLLSI